jgi:c-di-GMP phosphodiesterase
MAMAVSDRKALSRSESLEIAVGRQPIYDTRIEAFAYELLFRGGREQTAIFENGEWATARVFWNTFVEMGLESVTEGRPAFVNVTPAFLHGDCLNLFDKRNIALELRLLAPVDAALAQRIAQLSQAGFRLALDGFQPDESLVALASAVEVVKVDVRKRSESELRTVIAGVRPHGAKIVASHIESRAEFAACRNLGFDYFQGHFLAEPEIVGAERLPSDSVTRLRLLSALNRPDVDSDELERVISQDVALAFRLLRYINSGLFALSSRVESVRHALLLLGPRWVRAWSNLVILSGLADRRSDVFCMAMIRARMCELLAQEMGEKRTDVFHTAGLFSMLDVLIGRPLTEITSMLPLADELVRGLLQHEGRIGEAIDCAISYERFHWDEIACGDLGRALICNCYLKALRWTSEVRGALVA